MPYRQNAKPADPPKKFEFKRDPWVIIPYCLFVLIAFGAFLMDKIDWKAFTGFLVALNLPTVFGLKKMLSPEQAQEEPSDDRETPVDIGSQVVKNPLNPPRP